MSSTVHVGLDVMSIQGELLDADDRSAAAEELIGALGQAGLTAVAGAVTVPEGDDRAVDVFAAVVAMLTSSTVLPSLFKTLQTWLEQRKASVRIQLGDDQIELSGNTTREQQELVEAFLRRHDAELGRP
jgi:hypothetical protein